MCILNYLAAAAGVVTAQSANTGLTVLLLQVIVLRLNSPGNGNINPPSITVKQQQQQKETLLII